MVLHDSWVHTPKMLDKSPFQSHGWFVRLVFLLTFSPLQVLSSPWEDRAEAPAYCVADPSRSGSVGIEDKGLGGHQGPLWGNQMGRSGRYGETTIFAQPWCLKKLDEFGLKIRGEQIGGTSGVLPLATHTHKKIYIYTHIRYYIRT